MKVELKYSNIHRFFWWELLYGNFHLDPILGNPESTKHVTNTYKYTRMYEGADFKHPEGNVIHKYSVVTDPGSGWCERLRGDTKDVDQDTS